MSDEQTNLTALAESWRERARKCRDEAGEYRTRIQARLLTRAETLEVLVDELLAHLKQQSTDATDYHQKPISAMTDGELRAYRRERALAALTGLVANPQMDFFHVDAATEANMYADAVIEHERREEQGEI